MIAHAQSFRVSMVIVVDTNVLVSALLGSGPANRLIDACLQRRFEPIVGTALFSEYEAVMGRDVLFARSLLERAERDTVLDAFLSACRWVRIYYAWRPNLRDEGDNHLVELAVAGGAQAIVTRNVRDLRSGELRFDEIAVLTPQQLLGETP